MLAVKGIVPANPDPAAVQTLADVEITVGLDDRTLTTIVVDNDEKVGKL